MPSALVKEVEVDGVPCLAVVASRPLAENEEVTLDLGYQLEVGLNPYVCCVLNLPSFVEEIFSLLLRWLVLQNCATVALLGAGFSLAHRSQPLAMSVAAAAKLFFLLASSLSTLCWPSHPVLHVERGCSL